jgi:hypothetical protein
LFVGGLTVPAQDKPATALYQGFFNGSSNCADLLRDSNIAQTRINA